jgi:hypothetical protein
MSACLFKFKHPFTCLVAGATQSGKTTWTRRLLNGWKYLINMKKTNKLKVLWFHGHKQDIHKKNINDVDIKYLETMPDIEILNNEKPDIIVIDDLMDKMNDDKDTPILFTKISHHKNISVIYLVQNIFHKNINMRTISLNSHYINIMRGARLTQQVGILGNQIFPGKYKKVIEVYKKATKPLFGYLLLDLHPQSDERYRLRTKIFRNELTNLQKTEGLYSCPIFYEI